MRTSTILLLLLVLTSKAQALTYSCDDSINGSVASAFEAWNYAMDDVLTITRVHDNADVQISISSLPLGLSATGIVEGLTWFFSRGHVLVILEANCTYAIVMHEVGHSLGMVHSTNPMAVMYPAPPAFCYLTQDDVDAIRELYGLSPKTLDFACKASHRRLSVVLEDKYAAVYWGDGKSSVGKRAAHAYKRPGTYSVLMVSSTHRFQVTKDIAIK